MQKIKVSNETGSNLVQKVHIKHSSNLSMSKKITTKPANRIASQAFSASHRDVFASKMNQDLIMAVHTSAGNEQFGVQQFVSAVDSSKKGNITIPMSVNPTIQTSYKYKQGKRKPSRMLSTN